MSAPSARAQSSAIPWGFLGDGSMLVLVRQPPDGSEILSQDERLGTSSPTPILWEGRGLEIELTIDRAYLMKPPNKFTNYGVWRASRWMDTSPTPRDPPRPRPLCPFTWLFVCNL